MKTNEVKGKNDITNEREALWIVATMLYAICDAAEIDETTAMKIKTQGGDSKFEITVEDAVSRSMEILGVGKDESTTQPPTTEGGL